LADTVSSEKRSEMMAGIRARDTKPELIIRRGLHGLGYRFRLHDKRLPGKPDLVLRRFGAVIFVDGCFWHGHDCHLFKWPKSRRDFWKKKITGNKSRDVVKRQSLLDEHWRILTVRECAIKGKHRYGVDEILTFISRWLRSTAPCASVSGQESGGMVVSKKNTAGDYQP
jgi:DNA mismatch endonuclease, patch repair protein